MIETTIVGVTNITKEIERSPKTKDMPAWSVLRLKIQTKNQGEISIKLFADVNKQLNIKKVK